MKQLVSRINSAAAEEFNDAVADALDDIDSLIVKRRVKKAGRLRGKTGPPGDIDVLVVSRAKRRVFLIECKDLSLARTPREMAHEVNTLFRGTVRRKSTAEKHLERERWAASNLPALLEWLGLGWSKKWETEAIIVLDIHPITAYLAKSPVPVMAFAELVEHMKN